ncbi:unnamed protein product [Diamesa hyperborea]
MSSEIKNTNDSGLEEKELQSQKLSTIDNTSDEYLLNLPLFKVSLRVICLVTLFLPLGGLFICFVTGYIWQAEEIHETHCRVYNIIPSISSITGISPQKYLWRLCIALHISPRIIIAFVHRNYIKHHILSKIKNQNDYAKANRLVTILHWLNLIEVSALAGVTYVSNKENYPVHEKIFIVFMITSLTYMLVSLKLQSVLQPSGPSNPAEARSLRYKKLFFALSIASTIGLILFFLKHRFLCHDFAFSWFALCEYMVAFCNMAFHCTTSMIDFPQELYLMVKNGNMSFEPNENKTKSNQKLE